MIDYDKPILKDGKPLKIGMLAQHHCIRCIKESRALQKVGYTVYGNGNKVSYGTDGYENYHVWQNERQFKNSVKQLIDSGVSIYIGLMSQTYRLCGLEKLLTKCTKKRM